jgi:hypothetical protein
MYQNVAVRSRAENQNGPRRLLLLLRKTRLWAADIVGLALFYLLQIFGYLGRLFPGRFLPNDRNNDMERIFGERLEWMVC